MILPLRGNALPKAIRALSSIGPLGHPVSASSLDILVCRTKENSPSKKRTGNYKRQNRCFQLHRNIRFENCLLSARKHQLGEMKSVNPTDGCDTDKRLNGQHHPLSPP